MKKYYRYRVKQIGMSQFIIQKRWIFMWYSVDKNGNAVRKDEDARTFESLHLAFWKIDHWFRTDYPFYFYQ